MTIITVEEQLSGWYTLRRRVKEPAQLARVYERFAENVRFLSRVEILSFPESAIQRYEQLVRMKRGVRGNDLRIAAIALERSATRGKGVKLLASPSGRGSELSSGEGFSYRIARSPRL